MKTLSYMHYFVSDDLDSKNPTIHTDVPGTVLT